MPRPIRLLIHIDAMRHNLATIRQRVGRSRIWAVAKANAYGQGIDQAVAGFEQADGLAVLDLHEARLARDRGWSKPILLIEGAFGAQDLAEIRRLDAQSRNNVLRIGQKLCCRICDREAAIRLPIQPPHYCIPIAMRTG
jgi:alanine racemase